MAATTGADTTRQGQESSGRKWSIRPMREADITKCLEIWLQVELIEGRQTVLSALTTDPGGFFVAEMEGEVIGMCAGPMTRSDTAFMGFYAVEPRHQGIGVGRELWAKTLERLAGGRNIGLYGVPAMSAKYKKSGFNLEDSFRMLIYESTLGTDCKHLVCPDRLSSLDKHNLTLTSTEKNKWLVIGQNTRDGEKLGTKIDETRLFNQLVEYDKFVNHFSREKLLKNYILGDDIPLTVIMLMPRGYVAPSTIEPSAAIEVPKQRTCVETKTTTDKRDDEAATLSSNVQCCLSISSNLQDEEFDVVGYGCIRHDNNGGGMIGPLYANSDEFCEIILRQLMQHFPLQINGKYSAMSLTSNNSSAKILEKIGLKQMDQCSRMFTRFIPKASWSHIYFVHSPNFSLF